MRKLLALLTALWIATAATTVRAESPGYCVKLDAAEAQGLADAIAIGPPAAATSTGVAAVIADGLVHPSSLAAPVHGATGCEQWQLLPEGLIYRPYLAGVKESRIGGVWNYDNGNGSIWDVTLGGQAPLLRYGRVGGRRPEGWQVSLEASGQVRLDLDEDADVEATDYRFGVPITWGDSVHQTKFAFYHLSSHLGDEFLLKHSGFPRVNYSQNVLVYGHSLHFVENWRAYGEVGFGVDVDVAEPWQFQFGLEWAPETFTGFRGAPFAAVNAYLREEVDFGGNFVAQTGWAWRRDEASGLLRLGLQYYTGKNEQFSLYDDSEQKFGFGIWYDY